MLLNTTGIFKYSEFSETGFLQKVAYRGFYYPETINRTSAEVYGGSIFKIFCRARYFSNFKACIKYLRDHLVIEDKIIRVGIIINFLENL